LIASIGHKKYPWIFVHGHFLFALRNRRCPERKIRPYFCTKRMPGATLAPRNTFFVKLGKFGVSYFYEFATDKIPMKLCLFSKFGIMN